MVGLVVVLGEVGVLMFSVILFVLMFVLICVVVGLLLWCGS